MNVAVLGTGNIGGTPGLKWAQAGHAVKFGARDLNSSHVQSLRKTGEGDFSFDSIGNAIAFGEVVLFAVPGNTVAEVVGEYAAPLNRKIVIDATNNLSSSEVSGYSAFAAKAPQVKYYRAFNALGWENFANPRFGDVTADLFYCGNQDAQSGQAVERLIADLGLRPVSLGGIDQLPVVDSLVRLWFALAIGQKMGRHTAFKVLSDR
jgi:predicted dinucleotide-binding enzyme